MFGLDIYYSIFVRLSGIFLNLLILWILNSAYQEGSATSFALIFGIGISAAHLFTFGSTRTIYDFLQVKVIGLNSQKYKGVAFNALVSFAFIQCSFFFIIGFFVLLIYGRVLYSAVFLFTGLSVLLLVTGELLRRLEMLPHSIILENVFFQALFLIGLGIGMFFENNYSVETLVCISCVLCFLSIFCFLRKYILFDLCFFIFIAENFRKSMLSGLAQFLSSTSGRLPIFLTATIFEPGVSDGFTLIFSFIGFGGTAIQLSQSIIASSFFESVGSRSKILRVHRASGLFSALLFVSSIPLSTYILLTWEFFPITNSVVFLFVCQLFRVCLGCSGYILGRIGKVNIELIEVVASASVFSFLSLLFVDTIDRFCVYWGIYLVFRGILSYAFLLKAVRML